MFPEIPESLVNCKFVLHDTMYDAHEAAMDEMQANEAAAEASAAAARKTAVETQISKAASRRQ
jgi:hypothetical protein